MEPDQPLTVSYRLTVDEFLTAQASYLKYADWKPSSIWLTIGLEVPILAFVLWRLVVTQWLSFQQHFLQSVALLGLIAGAYILFGILIPVYLAPVINKRLTEQRDTRLFLQGPERDKLVSVTLRADALVTQAEGQPPRRYPWKAITRVVQTPQGFLFELPVRMLGPWVPAQALPSPAETEALAQRVRRWARKFVVAA